MLASFIDIRCVGADGEALPAEPPPAERVRRSVLDLLDATPLCAWATVTVDGRAHVNIGYFARSDGLELYLLSHPGSRHCRNVATNPSMAVAVFASTQNWTDPGRGVQLFGTSRPLTDEEAAEGARSYTRRFPAYGAWNRELQPGDPARAYRFYAFMPERVKILDERDFGDAVFVEARIVRTR